MSGLEEAYDKGFDAGREAEADDRLTERVEIGEIGGAFNALDAYFPKHMKGAEIIAEVEGSIPARIPEELTELLELVRMYGIRRPGWDR